ncbi:MAG TPA: RNA 2'-phosphotransferase [Anaerolineae bacterium]|nr:RNA 2'-phosphotransferase [Anaerolineae bacterium]HQK14505.1 RNA 2'-phosphotransferase [Anaerolineae bacterium]
MSQDPRREAQLRKLSRFLALLLRHRPDRFPIPMDAEGYTDLDGVMQILKGLPNFRWATRADIDAVLALPGRQRFEIIGGRIRALYGHSAIRPTYTPVAPPEVLYHGTAPKNCDAIRREGLRPMQRQYVHLATTPEMARSIALRHTNKPIILRIDAAHAYTAGVIFYHPEENIYLCEAVPEEFITFLPS